MGTSVFDDFIQEKLYPFFGDLTEPNIGLSESDLHIITNQTNVIYHCAGNMDGNEHLQESIRVKYIVIYAENLLTCVFVDQYIWYSSTLDFCKEMSFNFSFYSLVQSSTKGRRH